jgi:peptidyl-prolyl cis-trans isomerase A (cyclophilin A)
MSVVHLRITTLLACLALGLANPSAAQTAARGGATAAQAPLTPAQRRAVLLDPARAFWKTRAPATVTADIETSRGTVTLELIRAWAPVGVDRFYNLARAGYFDDSRFFRVILGFVAQFGIAGDPTVAKLWSHQRLPADSIRERNVRGTITYAQFTPTDRATNMFINLRDNPALDSLRFAPFGRVVQGMDVVDSLYAYYGEFPAADAPLGDPARLYNESNRYLDKKFPLLDRILKITIRPDTARRPN